MALRISLLSLVALAACGTAGGGTAPSAGPAASQPQAGQQPDRPQVTHQAASHGEVVDFARSWEGWDDREIGCIAYGKTLGLRGALRVRPFGKKGKGTELVLENGDALVVAYGVTDQHINLAGTPVIATGRYCNKQLQAANGRHFDIETLTLVE